MGTIIGKKVLKYTLKKIEYLEAAEKITNLFGVHEVDAGSNAMHYLRQAGVLDLWYEPVYEEEYIILLLGTSKVSVKVTAEGVEVDKTFFTFNELLSLKKNFETVLRIGQNLVTVSTFKIGCSTFSIEELRETIKHIHILRKKINKNIANAQD